MRMQRMRMQRMRKQRKRMQRMNMQLMRCISHRCINPWASPPDAHHPRMRITPGCASPPDAHHPRMHITPGCASPPDHPFNLFSILISKGIIQLLSPATNTINIQIKIYSPDPKSPKCQSGCYTCHNYGNGHVYGACVNVDDDKSLSGFSQKRIWGPSPSPPPPSKIDETVLLFYNEFSLLTFEEGTISFVSGGPYGPMGEPLPPSPPQNSTKLLNTGLLQPTFEEGIGCFVSVGPYGPGGVLSIFEGGGGGVPKSFSRKDPWTLIVMTHCELER